MALGNDITNMIRFIRMDIGDDGSTQTYSDTQLTTMVQKATMRVDAELASCLTSRGGTAVSGGYVQFEQALSGSTFLPSGVFVLPSGASTNGLPDPIFNLILLRSECMIAKRAHFDAAGKGIRVRDGDTEIDTSVSFAGLASLVNDQGGPCAEYQKMLEGYCAYIFRTTEGDITKYGTIIWAGTTRKRVQHAEAGPDGDIRTEYLGTFQDYLRSDGFGDTNNTIPNNTDRSS
jgi:hypothetical protein